MTFTQEIAVYPGGEEVVAGYFGRLLREGKSRAKIAKVMTSDYGLAANGLRMTRGFDGMLAELKR